LLNPQGLSIEKRGREWSGLLDNLMIYGLMGIAFGLFFVRLNHIIEYAFFVLLVVWILGQLKNGTLKWIKTPLDLPFLLYVAWVLICVPLAVDPDYSFGEWRKVAAHFLLFYFVVQTVKTKRQIHSILLAGVAGVVLLSLIESAYFLEQGQPLWTLRYRAGDLTGSSQWLSVYLVIGFPMLWIGFDMTKNGPRWSRILLGVGFAIVLLALFLSHTRGAWVAVGIQVFIFVLIKLTKKGWVVFGGAGAVGVLLVALYSPSIQKDISNISSFTNSKSMQYRFNTWSLAFQDIGEYPLTGIGLGKHSFGKLHPELGSGFHANLHNTFLSRAVQIGIPGFLFFIWIFFILMAKGFFLFRSFPDDSSGKIALAINLMVMGVIVRNLFDDMFIGTVSYLFFLVAGLLCPLVSYSEPNLRMVRKAEI